MRDVGEKQALPAHKNRRLREEQRQDSGWLAPQKQTIQVPRCRKGFVLEIAARMLLGDVVAQLTREA